MTTELHNIILFLVLVYSVNTTNVRNKSNSPPWGFINLNTNSNRNEGFLRSILEEETDLSVKLTKLLAWRPVDSDDGDKLKPLKPFETEDSLEEISESSEEKPHHSVTYELLQRESASPNLCTYPFCTCSRGVLFCECQSKNQSITLSEAITALVPPTIETIHLRSCKTVKVITFYPLHSLKEVFILDTERVEYSPDERSSANIKTIFFGKVGTLEIGPRVLRSSIKFVYLVSCNILEVNRYTFSGLKQLTVFDMNDVRFENDLRLSPSDFVIPTQDRGYQMKEFRIVSSVLGKLNAYFFVGVSKAVFINNSTFEVAMKGVINISGEDIFFTNNFVEGIYPHGLIFNPTRIVRISNNVIKSGITSSLIRLDFPSNEIDSVIIQQSKIRDAYKFLDVKARYIEISNCSLNLNQEDVISTTSQEFIFKNNVVDNLATESISIRVFNTLIFEEITIDHLQSGAFERIKILKTNTIGEKDVSWKNIKILAAEDGFLKLDQSLLQSEEFEIQDLELNLRCSCELMARAFGFPDLEHMDQTIERIAFEFQERTNSRNVNNYMKIQNATFCQNKGELVAWNKFDLCQEQVSNNQTGGSTDAVYDSQKDSSKINQATIIVPTILLFICCVVVGVGTYLFRQNIKKRALSMFVVPTTVAKSGTVELETAMSYEPTPNEVVEFEMTEAFYSNCAPDVIQVAVRKSLRDADEYKVVTKY